MAPEIKNRNAACRKGGMASTENRIARYVEPQTIYTANKATQIFVFIHFFLCRSRFKRDLHYLIISFLLDHRCIHKLSRQQRFLSLRAIAVITKITDLAYHSMTGNQHRNGVMSNRCANGS